MLSLRDVTEEYIAHIQDMKDSALPGHDVNQVLRRDAVEGLRFVQMEELPEGLGALVAMAVLFHDGGRIVEGKYYHPQNPHGQWIPHAQLSYQFLRGIFDQKKYSDIPVPLKHHFYYAALAHSGENGKSYLSRAVQACDRMQLIGAEGFFRSIAFIVGLLGLSIDYPLNRNFANALPPYEGNHTVISEMEFFARNMRENIGSGHQVWQHKKAVENLALLLGYCEVNPDLYQQIFAPEHQGKDLGAGKRKIENDVFEEARSLSQEFLSMAHSQPQETSPDFISQRIIREIESPASSARLQDHMKQAITSAVAGTPSDQFSGLARVVFIASQILEKQNQQDQDILKTANESGYPVYEVIARTALGLC